MAWTFLVFYDPSFFFLLICAKDLLFHQNAGHDTISMHMSLTRNNMYIYVCKRSHSFHPSQLLLLLVMVGGFPSLTKLFRRERCKTNTYLGTTHSRSYRGGKGHPIPAYRNCFECLCEQFENNRCFLGSEPCCKN